MTLASDKHLEDSLAEFNDKVNALAGSGDSQELLEAYINRGCILAMMEYYVSATEDFDDAAEILERMEESGISTDVGCYVKTYVSRGELSPEGDYDGLVDNYLKAAQRLSELKESSKYYDRRKTVLMCIGCCEDLIDCGHPSDIGPFAEKLLSLLVGKDDEWSRNRYLELLNLQGQAYHESQQDDRSMEEYSDAVAVGQGLLEKGILDDVTALAYSFIARGDLEQEAGLMDQFVIDRKAAISLLEGMLTNNRLEEKEVLVKLHQDMANYYLSTNNVKEAETHLMRQVILNMDGAKDYIRDYSDRKN